MSKLENEEKVFIMFQELIFHPLARVVLSHPETDVDKYDIFLESLDIVEFTYNKSTQEYDLWRDRVLLNLYEKYRLPTNIKPDYSTIHKMLIQRKDIDNMYDAIENMKSLYQDMPRRRKRR